MKITDKDRETIMFTWTQADVQRFEDEEMTFRVYVKSSDDKDDMFGAKLWR